MMGAQKSVHAGKAKIDVNLDFTHKLCSMLLLHPQLRVPEGSFSQIIGRLSVQHPNIFGGGEKLDAVWDKGLCESNVLITIRRPKPDWLTHKSVMVQYSASPEIGVHGVPSDSLSRVFSGGVNLCRFSAGIDISEPAGSNWSNTTCIKVEGSGWISCHLQVVEIYDQHLFLLCDIKQMVQSHFVLLIIHFNSGNFHDNMIVLRQDSRYAVADDRSFSRINFEIEQGVSPLPKWLLFNRFKFQISKGIKLGSAFLLASLTGGSIVGDMAPYQAFSIGGLGNVRGYGVGAVGSGRSCIIANSELIVPLMKELEGAIFMDYGTDLGTAHLVPGNPGFRKGKPGRGLGFGHGLRFNLPAGQLQVDYAINVLRQKTIYFGISSSTS